MTTIYQSFWMKPYFEDTDGGTSLRAEGRKLGGFPNEKYFYMSWTLSILKLREFYKNVTLLCDSPAQQMLVEELRLPYTDVVCCFDNLNSYPPSLWAVGKIFAYQQARAPFIHVDGDVLIWEKLPSLAGGPKLLFQYYEFDDSYAGVLQTLSENFRYMPPVMVDFMNSKRSTVSINAGILGSNDPEFVQEYTEAALRFIDLNRDLLHLVDTQGFNMVFEQMLCYLLAEKRNLELCPYFPYDRDNIPEQAPRINAFIDVPSKAKYIHLMGDFKRRKFECYQLEQRLRYEYPQHHKKVLELVGAGLTV